METIILQTINVLPQLVVYLVIVFVESCKKNSSSRQYFKLLNQQNQYS